MRKVTNPNILNKIDTPEKAYVVGFIATDGHISNNNEISIEIQEPDKKILEKIEEILQLRHSFYYRRNSCRLSFTSKQIADDLKKIGIPAGKKSHILKPPNIPEEFLSAFWLGAMDGDGSLYSTKEVNGQPERPGINFVGSKEMCEGIKEFLNINTKILQVNGSYIVKKQCKNPSFWLSVYNKLYSEYIIENGIFLQRKYYFLRNLIETFKYYKGDNI